MDSFSRRMNKMEAVDVPAVDAAQSTSKLNIENIFVSFENNRYLWYRNRIKV